MSNAVFAQETISTWTFDPKDMIPEAVREDRFTFPVEVLHAFHLQGLKLGAIIKEIEATTIVDGELEFIPTGEKESFAIVQRYDENDGGALATPVFLKAGQKIALRGYGDFIALNTN